MVREEEGEVNLPNSSSPPLTASPFCSSAPHSLGPGEVPNLQATECFAVPGRRGGLGFPASPTAHGLWP